MQLLTITEVARECGVSPAVISRAFYSGRLSRDDCPRVGGRTVMDRNYVEWQVKPLLRRQGYRIGKAEAANA